MAPAPLLYYAPVRSFDLAFAAIRLPVDYALAVAAWFAALGLRLQPGFLASFQEPAASSPDLLPYALFALVSSLFLLPLLALEGAYGLRRRLLMLDCLRAAMAVGVWLMGITAYFFFAREFFFSRLALVYLAVLAVLFLCVGRFFRPEELFQPTAEQLLMLYGAGEA